MYQIRVTLLGTEPSIWRRVLVPRHYSFWDLHMAIQNAFGWNNSHLHQFDIGGECIGIPDEDAPRTLPGWGEKIAARLSPGWRCIYRYDFGDDWEHEVVVEELVKKDYRRPRCTDGAGPTLLDDCGGAHRFNEILRGLERGKLERGLREWLGDWRPKVFDPADVVFEDPKRALENVHAAQSDLHALHDMEELTDEMRAEILARGDAAVEPLLEVLFEHADEEECPAPMHAAALLGELRSPRAIEPLLDLLVRIAPEDPLCDAIIMALSSIGEPALEPTLVRWRQVRADRDQAVLYEEVLANLGVKDERIYDILMKGFRGDPLIAWYLGTYGDPRCLPDLIRAFDNSDPMAVTAIGETIEKLGGELTREQTAELAAAREMLTPRDPVRRVEPKVGRNDPCPCGSGKKYKRCHGATS
jgi:hypothetical protein